jgi:hypothetical protein
VVIASPYGFKEHSKGRWGLVSEEAAGITFRGRPVIIEHYESFYRETREVRWKKGQAWPAKCEGDVAPKEVRKAVAGGKDIYFYACPATDLSQPTWQDRYYEIPLDSEEPGVAAVIRLRYVHRVQAKLPPAAELRKLYGARNPGGYPRKFQSEVLPLIAEGTNKSKIDGLGLKAVIESLLTLYQEGWASPDSYTGKVVPSID